MIPVYSSKPQATGLTQLSTTASLDEAKAQTTDKCLAVLFWAEWHAPCTQLRDQMAEMSKVYHLIKFTWANVDEANELVDSFDI